MKLLTFLMTDNTIRKYLSDDKGLVALCELWDHFHYMSNKTDVRELLLSISEDKFSASDAYTIAGKQIEAYINAATGETTYYYSNALDNFSLFFDVIGEPKDDLLAQVSRSATSY